MGTPATTGVEPVAPSVEQQAPAIARSSDDEMPLVETATTGSELVDATAPDEPAAEAPPSSEIEPTPLPHMLDAPSEMAADDNADSKEDNFSDASDVFAAPAFGDDHEPVEVSQSPELLPEQISEQPPVNEIVTTAAVASLAASASASASTPTSAPEPVSDKPMSSPAIETALSDLIRPIVVQWLEQNAARLVADAMQSDQTDVTVKD